MLNYSVNHRSSFWLRVFSNSKVNGAPYWGDNLPAYQWAWPTGTYLQQRLRTVRAGTGDIDVTITANEAVGLAAKRIGGHQPVYGIGSRIDVALTLGRAAFELQRLCVCGGDFRFDRKMIGGGACRG